MCVRKTNIVSRNPTFRFKKTFYFYVPFYANDSIVNIDDYYFRVVILFTKIKKISSRLSSFFSVLFDRFFII